MSPGLLDYNILLLLTYVSHYKFRTFQIYVFKSKLHLLLLLLLSLLLLLLLLLLFVLQAFVTCSKSRPIWRIGGMVES